MKIKVFNETKTDLKREKKQLKTLFKVVNDSNNLSVIFVLDERIKELNKTYRNINEVTDVLSFKSDEENYLGDIFIAIDKANLQATLFKHSLKREIGFLAVHGYLHLKGYNHHTKEEEKKMNDLTEEILTKANIKRSEQ